MSKKTTLEGGCLCGKISVTLQNVEPHVGVCHCDMCLRWCGGPGMAIDVGEQISVSGQKHMKVYDSSEWAERAFCSECGSNLYYRLKAANRHFVYAGLFTDNPNLVLDHQIYIDKKPAYYNFAEQTPKLTAAEVEAMFAES